MLASAELMEILKENETRAYSHHTKSKLIDLYIFERGLIPEKMLQEQAKKDIDPKYNYLMQIR